MGTNNEIDVSAALERVQKFRTAIESAKTERAELSGQLTGALEQLQESGADSVPLGKKLHEQLKKQQSQLNEEITIGLAALEKEYEW